MRNARRIVPLFALTLTLNACGLTARVEPDRAGPNITDTEQQIAWYEDALPTMTPDQVDQAYPLIQADRDEEDAYYAAIHNRDAAALAAAKKRLAAAVTAAAPVMNQYKR